MKLPLLISVPHAGLEVPAPAAPYCILTKAEIAADGDEQAAEIYAIEPEVRAYLTTSIARAIVDMNRAEDDRRKDGVVKTHTCWDVPVYEPFPPDEVVEALIERHHRPYHARLAELARGEVRLGIDCHTMAALGPPVGPDPGAERPWICLGNADGTCPASWIESMADCLERAFGARPSINRPFAGGYITRRHASELPWMQLEISRAPFHTAAEKRRRLLAALRQWGDVCR